MGHHSSKVNNTKHFELQSIEVIEYESFERDEYVLRNPKIDLTGQIRLHHGHMVLQSTSQGWSL